MGRQCCLFRPPLSMPRGEGRKWGVKQLKSVYQGSWYPSPTERYYQISEHCRLILIHNSWSSYRPSKHSRTWSRRMKRAFSRGSTSLSITPSKWSAWQILVWNGQFMAVKLNTVLIGVITYSPPPRPSSSPAAKVPLKRLSACSISLERDAKCKRS